MIQAIELYRVEGEAAPVVRRDEVAVEEPLEIRVEGHMVAVAMRTPGNDRELAAGWALSEKIARSRADIADVVLRPGAEDGRGAMVDIMLADPVAFNPDQHRRNVLTNASCGLCGAGSTEQVLRDFPKVTGDFRIDAKRLKGLPTQLRGAQPTFARTGGVHACALFAESGELLAVREDVGRHNALDKLNGWALLQQMLPLSAHVLLLSGRVSLEMVQKALAAGIPVIAAIGGPTSLAVELARASGQCLAAFLRDTGFNVYAGLERLRGAGRL
jgi:FdhD protein